MIAAVAVVSAPAHAGPVAVSAPAGRADNAAIAIARQTGASIVIADPEVAARRVGAIGGRMSADAAVKKLSRAAGARADAVGTSDWRIVE